MSFSSFNPGVGNDPVIQLPRLYLDGLNLSVASTTVMAIGPGQARDAADNIDIPVSQPNLFGNVLPAILNAGVQQALFVNGAVNGVNGLDTGSLIATMDYAIYLIADSRGNNNPAGMLSLTSNVSPIMPQGYDSARLLGFVQTDGSAHFVASSTNPINMRNVKSYYLSPVSSVLSGGTATSFTAIDLSTPIPTTTARDVIAYIQITFTPFAAGDTVQFRPSGEGTPQTSNLLTIVGAVAGVAQTQYVAIICGVASSKPEIDYKVTSSSDSVSVNVYGYSYIPTSYVP